MYRIWLVILFCLSLALSSHNFLISAQPTPNILKPHVSSEKVITKSESAVTDANSQLIPNHPRGDVRLVVVSDLNGAYGSTDYDPEIDQAIKLIPLWQPDLVICGGDMIAGQKQSLSVEQIRAMWAAFDQHIAEPLRNAQIPFGFTIGNHDASGAIAADGTFSFAKERNLATEYWRNPQHHPGVKFVDYYEFPFYYTFATKDIFFVVWDGSSHRIPPDKLAWVEQVLASPASKQAKMRIMLGHLPLYAVAEGRNQPGEVMANAEQLRAMLERYQVHTYISGHHHAYYPAHRGSLQLLHTGNLGAGSRVLIDSKLPPRKTLTVIDINFKTPELTTYTTYEMPTLKLIKDQQLPSILVGHNGFVLRRDIEWQDLTTDEKNLCQNRLGTKLCQP